MRDENKNRSEAPGSAGIFRRCFLVAFLCLISGASASVCMGQQKSEREKVRISAIQARLFYENTGAFSENVLTEKGADLWNTPFDWTYSTFVIVEADGVPEYLNAPFRIELRARYIPFDRESGSITVRQTDTIRNGSENGKAYAGFWLRRTGCNPVYLTARIPGRASRLVKATIQFGCGE